MIQTEQVVAQPMTLAVAGPSKIWPAYATWKRFNLHLFLMYMALHLTVLAVPFTFSWQGLAAFVVTYFMTTCCGITLCYHRLLAHRSYKTSKPVKYFLSFLACLAFQRGPIWWVATHRLHHSEVDKPLDPHSPRVSFIWSHFLWAFFRHPQLDESQETLCRLARDIYTDPGMQFLERNYTLINTLFLAALFGIGYALGGLKIGLSVLIWGGFFRMALTLHITWCVNSIAHIWGYRNYMTPDDSRNNWWVALLTYGEGWHNNHHFDQRAARNGHRWYEVDVTYYLICLMHQFRLASDVIPVSKRHR